MPSLPPRNASLPPVVIIGSCDRRQSTFPFSDNQNSPSSQDPQRQERQFLRPSRGQVVLPARSASEYCSPSGETEAGSAGTQPDQGITRSTVRQWSSSAPGSSPPPGAFRATIGHRSSCLGKSNRSTVRRCRLFTPAGLGPLLLLLPLHRLTGRASPSWPAPPGNSAHSPRRSPRDAPTGRSPPLSSSGP
jgi:hypothetical protein